MMKRTFIAVKINPSKELLNAYYYLKSVFTDDDIKWVEPDKLHITLKFIGDTPDQQIPLINTVMEEIAASSRKFEMRVRNFGIFGNSRHVRVFWLGIEDEGRLKTIAANINHKLFKYGIPKEDKEFKPHLTIARVKYLRNPYKLQEIIQNYFETEFQKEMISEIIFFESILRPNGPLYMKINSFNLKQFPDISNTNQ